jgi:hypothetical protein
MNYYKSGGCMFLDEGSRWGLQVKVWAPGDGHDELTVDLWNTRTTEPLWKGTLEQLGEIVLAHIEREMSREPDSEATVGPIPDNGHELAGFSIEAMAKRVAGL